MKVTIEKKTICLFRPVRTFLKLVIQVSWLGMVWSTAGCSIGTGVVSADLFDDINSKNDNPELSQTNDSLTGAQLYDRNCAACHGGMEFSTKLNVTFAEIKSALEDIEQMKATPVLALLTDTQLKAIAEALRVELKSEIRQLKQNAVRRQTVNEIDATLSDILFDTTGPATLFLPGDELAPFDTHSENQNASQPLIDALERMARDVTQRLFANSQAYAQVVQCPDSLANDSDCMRKFLERVGQRFFRRPLLETEIERFLTVAMQEANSEADFTAGVSMALTIFLQHPEFIYRFEVGSENGEGGFRLNGYELASRVSYFLFGKGPSQQMLDAVTAGHFSTKEKLHSYVEAQLDSPEVREQTNNFHAQWLGYYESPHAPELALPMREEADRMVEGVLFDKKQPWLELLKTKETQVDGTLAEIYGMAYTGSGFQSKTFTGMRKGILGTGAFLSVAAKFADTSPTQRGKFIRERLLCNPVPPPPPNLNTDAPPVSTSQGSCKIDRYEAHRQEGTTCFGCHQQMDPVGFGLEMFDGTGRYREFETAADGNPDLDCPIDYDGALDEQTFRGPGQLADAIAGSGQMEACAAEQLYHFAMGFPLSREEKGYARNLAQEMTASGGTWDQLVLALVTSDVFLNRLEVEE